MSERRFYLAEVDEGFFRWDKAITESELKRRLHQILRLQPTDIYGNCDYDLAISTLLHGEGKEKPIPRPDEWPHVPFPKKPQPDPWEAWIQEMPVAEIRNVVTIGADCDEDLAAWFRKMPVRK